MKKTALLAGLFTVSMWLAGCSGSVGLDWGQKNTEYERQSGPAQP